MKVSGKEAIDALFEGKILVDANGTKRKLMDKILYYLENGEWKTSSIGFANILGKEFTIEELPKYQVLYYDKLGERFGVSMCVFDTVEAFNEEVDNDDCEFIRFITEEIPE